MAAPDGVGRAGDRQSDALSPRRKLYSFTGGFFRQKQIRRILQLSGYDLKLGWPKPRDTIAVWGRNRRSARGLWVSGKTKAVILTVEDAFLRSVLTGRSGVPPLGLVLDQKAAYFNASQPSDLEDILNDADLGAPDLARRARIGMARLRALHLSKYNAFTPESSPPVQDYVLVIDQTRNDASILFGGGDAGCFQQMLTAARAENPDRHILIKTHPEVAAKYRAGYFSTKDQDDNTTVLSHALSPWTLLSGAHKVYTVTSLMGFEAILAGHKPVVFGQPFYAGWGLSDDRRAMARRRRTLSAAELFAGAMLLYPKWYDPYRDQLCDFETVVDTLAAQVRAWREDHQGYTALGMRLWKRGHLNRFFKTPHRSLRFANISDAPSGNPAKTMIWAGKSTPALGQVFADKALPLYRLEDGFLRSNGLGAELVPPMSLVLDDLGIYYDPTQESRLERLIATAANRPDNRLRRARALQAQLVQSGVSKYNVGAAPNSGDWPQDRLKILVPGQVEDDASIRLGAGKVNTNLGLLQKVRAENPTAFIVFKPHPDVESGLRVGKIPKPQVLDLADLILENTHATPAIKACDAVWTITSLIGFEALLQGKAVTCLGQPFYAGWGLTTDLGANISRRCASPSLAALVQAVLIDYPRYFDPKTGLACPAEVVVERLQSGAASPTGAGLRGLSKLQGVFASFAWIWR